jgi:hypothetical protein
MISYDETKTWFDENKQKIVLVICFALVFVIGFGTGRFDKELTARRAQINSQNNYTTKSVDNTTKKTGEGITETKAPAKEPAQNNPEVLGANVDKACPVKGNQTSKIYHLPRGTFYNTLKSPKCFNTEAEARAAGYRRSGR